MKRLRRKHGEGGITSTGHVLISRQGVRRLAHVLIVEKILGHALPPGAEVHHVNGVASDNKNENLVVCPSRAYHKLLHVRTRALEASGHADWRKCPHCKKYGDPANMLPHKSEGRPTFYEHALCKKRYKAAWDARP